MIKDDKMKINLYDRVLLKDGSLASIVEIFEEDKAYLADIDKKETPIQTILKLMI